MEKDTQKILEQSYLDLAPLSKRWRKEFRLHKHTLDLILKYAGEIPGKKILDIGCGLGILIRALINLGAVAEGVDKHILNEWGILEDVEKVWEKNNIKVTLDDVLATEFAESSFDAVVSEDLFEHLRFTQKEFLEQAYRILKPDGFLFLATPNIASVFNRLRALFGKSPYWNLEDFFLNKQPFGHMREFTAGELKHMARLVGFKIVEIKNYNIYWRKEWFFDFRKWPKAIAVLLSYLIPERGDVLFMVARK